MSMRFDEYWNLNVYLNFDHHVEILHNESPIERKWLAELITEELIATDKGILLVADMGYGKSSIVSNIVCAEEYSTWFNMRKIVLAYHFCRYDSIQSTNSAHFIRLLAGSIVKHYPELGNAILLDSMASEILYQLHCEQDPVNCLEIAILAPLRKKWNNYQFIIIIDGLDECDTSGKNSILYMLSRQLENFPSNVKFIFTSRNIEKIINKFKRMKVIPLDSKSFYKDNIDDITAYIRHTTELSLLQNEISLLAKESRGNFLHVKLYLQYCLKTRICDFKTIPDKLETVYQLNFDRIFENDLKLFDECRPVLEVLCAMTTAITEQQVIQIANITSEERQRKIELLLGNELGHFLRVTDNDVSFVHKSIPDFLTNTSRKHLPYFIRKKNGHKLLANYFLRSLNRSQNSKLVDAVHHVALSEEVKYQTTLLQYKSLIKTQTNKSMESYLHETVRRFNSYSTTCLMLKLITTQYLDTTDERNLSSAFIAAAYGHDESLRCLLNEGANVNFKVRFSNLYLYHGQELVRFCKYVYFCGYSMLHIASQNGHLQIVKTIIKSNKSLAYAITDMGLNAFQLAAENGHIDTATIFLRNNEAFADALSLHHASQNGHCKMVELLLSYGVRDECLPCNGSLYWTPLISNRQQQDFRIPKIQNELTYEWLELQYNFQDDWHLISCETALDAAVRKGHLQTVRILLKQDKNALNCTAYDGKTPIMTAIQYNRTDIFQYLLEFAWDWQTPCRKTVYYGTENWKLSASERALLERNQCPNGASIVHLIAIYDNIQMLDLLYKSGFKKFEEKDDNSLIPLHYAFCRNSYMFIFEAKQLGLQFDKRSNNGTTPYHSAAICGSLALHDLMNTDQKYIIPDVYDYDKRSILQYALSKSYSHDDVPNVDKSTYFQFRVAIDSRHNIYHLDSKGRNCLHYAAKGGNHFAFDYAVEPSNGIDFSKLISQKDISGLTPFEELFHSMPKRESYEAIKIPTDCELKDTFYTSCESNFTYLLSPHEMCIWKVAIHLRNNNGFDKINIERLIRLSLHKSRVYPNLILKMYASNEFHKAVLSTPDLSNAVAEFKGPYFAEFILTDSSALNCKGGHSPLHRFVMNFRNMYWQYANSEFLDRILKHKTASFLDTCFDAYGYNLLHRSVMGGNIKAVQYLREKGMAIDRETRKKESMVVLSILKAPYLIDGYLPHYYSNSSRSYFLEYLLNNKSESIVLTDIGVVDFDETATYILNAAYLYSKLGKMYLKHTLCTPGKRQLGLVHIAASKGLIRFLQKSKSLFGADILNCADINKVTPYYLAHIYNQNRINHWLGGFVKDKIQPEPEIESLLLFNIISNFKQNKIYDWTCRLQFSVRFPNIFRNTMKRCIYKDKTPNIFAVNPQKIMNVEFIHLTLTFLNYFEEMRDHNRKFCSGTLFEDAQDACSDTVEISNFAKTSIRKISSSVTIQLQKVMMFGISDSMFVFQNLFLHQNIRSKYLQTLSFHSVFSLRYRYLHKLGTEEDLHREWLRHIAKKVITVQQKFDFSAYVKYESQLMLKMQQSIRHRYLQIKAEKLNSRTEETELKHAVSNIYLVAFDWPDIKTVKDLNTLESKVTWEFSGHEDLLLFTANNLKGYKLPKKITQFPNISILLQKAKVKSKRILTVMKQIPEKGSSSSLQMIRSISEAIVNFKQ